MKNACVIVILIIVAILGLGCSSKQMTALKDKLVQPQEEKPVTIKPLEDVELAQTILMPRPYELSLSRDPFKPLVGKQAAGQEAATEQDISLIGILSRQQQSVALLEVAGETNLFRVSDKVGKYTIKAIEAQRVLLEKDGHTHILELGDE